MSSAAMSRVARVLERMANQNTFADVGMDFKVSVPPLIPHQILPTVSPPSAFLYACQESQNHSRNH